MRVVCLALGVWLLAGPVSAQTGLRSASLPDRPPGAPMPWLRLPTASLPDRDPMQPMPPSQRDLFLVGPHAPALSGLRSASLPDRSPGAALPSLRLPAASLSDRRPGAPAPSLRLPTASLPDLEPMQPGNHYQTTPVTAIASPDEAAAPRDDLATDATGVKETAAAPGIPKTFYVIPRCYAADRPPRVPLPEGCDPSRLRVVPPSARDISGAVR